MLRRFLLCALVTSFALVIPATAVNAAPETTPVSEPTPTPSTAAAPCVRISCAPIGSITVDPGEGVASTEISITGECGRTSPTSSLVGAIVGGAVPGVRIVGFAPDFDRRAGTFVQAPNPSAVFDSAPAVPLGLYYFAGECFLYDGDVPAEEYLDPNSPGLLLHWLTPPGNFCLYEADNDPAGCTSTPGFADLAHQFGAWGFFSGQVIGEIGTLFDVAPETTTTQAETTATTRRRTTSTTTAATSPATAPATTTTLKKPCGGKYEPKCP